MSAKRKHMKKLASLSALGAGAVALTAPNADAGIVSVTGLNVKVGFDSANGFGAGSGPLSVPGGNFSFHTYARGFGYGTFGSSSGSRGTVRLIRLALGSMSFAAGASPQTGPYGTYRPVISITGVGAVWGGRSGRSSAMVGGRYFGRRFFTTYSPGAGSTYYSSYGGYYVPSSAPINGLFGNGKFTNEYALFKFGDPFNPNYGWVQLSYAVTNTSDPAGSNGPNLTVVAYGYETAPGVQIAAGDLGSGTPTPEPASVELSGMAALALGAEGVRRWRKARKAA